MDFEGVIIEESLRDTSVLKDMHIASTKVEPVTEEHKTPWLKQWTLHTVVIPEKEAEKVADMLSRALDTKDSWYADFKNDHIHFIIYRDKVFKVDRSKKENYDAATKYGIKQGIPEYQVDFSPHMKEWIR
jgi:hypothetical protein